MSSPVEADVLTEVPLALKRLIRYIARGFYGIEHALVIDMLVHHPCIKEDDLLELLKFERKQLRALINTLRNDKFIKVRMRVETDIEGKTTRHNYYFINYSVYVNVVKYKLDHMRRKIEMEERDSTSRASFKCPQCEKTFTDLEADQLFDFMSNSLKCTYCQSEVTEEASNLPAQDARTLMVKFNEQLEPIFALLREVEDIKLAPEILEPEPMDIKTGRTSTGDKLRERNTGVWSGENTRNINHFATENTITISMGGDNQANLPKKAVKEQPIWMRESTIEGASQEPNIMGKSNPVMDNPGKAPETDDIMRTLLAHEKKAPSTSHIPSQIPGGIGGASDEDSSTSESEDETMKPAPPVEVPMFTIGAPVEEMESDEDEDSEPMVRVGGQQVPYHEVTEEMVKHMTPSEKDEYIRIGQEMYKDMYD